MAGAEEELEAHCDWMRRIAERGDAMRRDELDEAKAFFRRFVADHGDQLPARLIEQVAVAVDWLCVIEAALDERG